MSPVIALRSERRDKANITHRRRRVKWIKILWFISGPAYWQMGACFGRLKAFPARSALSMNIADISARIARLDKLCRGLQEEANRRRFRCPLLTDEERVGYVEALERAVCGLGGVRAVLIRVRERLKKDA
jgi:hypothetical protein